MGLTVALGAQTGSGRGSVLAALLLGTGLLAGSQAAEAACDTFAPASDATVSCSGANTQGVLGAASDRVTLDLLAGGSIVPTSGPSIWLGADADITLRGGSLVGNDTLSGNVAILIGDSSIVTLDGTIQSQGGITGPTQGGGSTGFSNAMITIGSTGHILTTGTFQNAGLDGRAGGNTYMINGEIKASGTSGQGIRPGDNDKITIGSTGSVKTLSGDTSDAIDGFGKTGVTVTMDAGSTIQIEGIGRGIQLGDNADVTVAGTITSTGAAVSPSNSSGGVGIDVGVNSTVWLKEGGQIVTGNTGGLGNSGLGGIGISTFTTGASNATIIVDGLIDTQKALGIFSGTGDDITIGATGKITTRGTAHGIFGNNFTSIGNDTVTIDVAGRIEALGTGSAIYLQADNATFGVEAAQLHANITVQEGGSLFAQSAPAYSQLDGCCGYPEVIDNLVVAGTIARGNAGTAINLDDGADTITLLPTYSITGNIAGGSNADIGPETDTFALDGVANTSGSFDFDSNVITGFEQGRKLGAGMWTLSGTAGAGLTGGFDVENGTLAVNGSMTSAMFDVFSGARLQGGGTLGGLAASGTVAPGNSIGTMHVSGDVSFSSGSTFEVEVDDTGLSDLLTADGSATLTGGSVLAMPLPGNYPPSYQYTILTATGGVTGAFDDVASSSAFFSPELTYDANNVYLTLTQVADFAAIGNTPNQKATGAAIQNLGSGNPVFDAVVAIADESEARAAFDNLSGEVHATAFGVAFDDPWFRDGILSRLRDGEAVNAPAAPLAYAPPPATTPAFDAVLPAGGWTMWALRPDAYGATTRLDADGNAAATTEHTVGVMAGADRSNGAFTGGFAGGVQFDSIDLPDRSSHATIQSANLGIYGAWTAGGWRLRTGAVGALHQFDTTRTITVPGLESTATANTFGWGGQVFGEIGRRFTAGRTSIEPYAGLRYAGLWRGAFSETGAGAADLVAPGKGENGLLSILGVSFDTAMVLPDGRVLSPHATAAWEHGFFDATPTADLAFSGTAGAFRILGPTQGADTLRFDLGADLTMSATAKAFLAWQGAVFAGGSVNALRTGATIHF